MLEELVIQSYLRPRNGYAQLETTNNAFFLEGPKSDGDWESFVDWFDSNPKYAWVPILDWFEPGSFGMFIRRPMDPLRHDKLHLRAFVVKHELVHKISLGDCCKKFFGISYETDLPQSIVTKRLVVSVDMSQGRSKYALPLELYCTPPGLTIRCFI